VAGWRIAGEHQAIIDVILLVMHRRAVRVVPLTLLLAGTVVAGLFLRDIEQRAGERITTVNDVDTRLTLLIDVLAGIGTAQQSYVAPGQGQEPWFERTSALVGRLHDEIGGLQPLLQSPAAPEAVQSLADEAEALITADTRARENLRLGQTLMAADVIFSDSRNTIDTMTGRVRDLRAAEHSAGDLQRSALGRERWAILAAAALLWVVGVLALMSTARTRVGPSDATAEPVADDLRLSESQGVPAATVDLTAAAELCTALSRVTAAADLRDLLGQATGILDASGLILWMGAGEELFAVTTHGYRPHVIARIRPIGRGADNATAAAWRTGEVTTVAAGREGTGAIVVPLFSPDACVGVLAVEVRPGREDDPATRAIANMIAAQLATAVPAWPVASPVSLRSAGM
jgi:hypothetical protein